MGNILLRILTSSHPLLPLINSKWLFLWAEGEAKPSYDPVIILSLFLQPSGCKFRGKT